ncbi:MAG: hypothetical protein ACI97N_002636 [Cognaticolwellia sp.]
MYSMQDFFIFLNFQYSSKLYQNSPNVGDKTPNVGDISPKCMGTCDVVCRINYPKGELHFKK